MKKAILIAMMGAILCSLALVGCASSPTLDKQVKVGAMTLKVPSKWVETQNDDESNSLGTYLTYQVSPEDKSGSILVSGMNWKSSMKETIQSEYQESEDTLKKTMSDAGLSISDYQSNLTEKGVIDGYQVALQEESYKLKKSDDSVVDMDEKTLYLFSASMHYRIYISGVDPDALLKTISFD